MSKYAGNNTVQLTRPTRSQFDLSHYRRTTIKQGELTPVMVTECVPSDTFRGSSEILVRLAPLLAPIYDNLTLYVHFYFIPNRILWLDWEEFITGGRLGVGIDPEEAPIPPYAGAAWLLTNNFLGKGLLADHLGLPDLAALPGYTNPAQYNNVGIDTLPFLAYSRVWYDYYRDRNFTSDDYMNWPVASGDMGGSGFLPYYQMRTRHYEKDYYTAALPFTQRGEEVLMPLAGTGSVSYLQNTVLKNGTNMSGTNSATGAWQTNASIAGSPPIVPGTVARDSAGTAVRFENIDEVLIDASDVSINDFRTAYSLQVWLERNAIAGSRYTESTQAHFGVRPQDSRLQRAEYIGGGRMNIKISEIVSTAYSDDGTDVVPLANLAGHGITYGNTNSFTYFCPEHGFILGIASIMAPGSYYQGISKMWRRRSFLDYPWPTFAKLGEQNVDKAELFASAANLTENADGLLPLFGYQSRYSDWKQLMSTNHGDFQDDLLFWTATRKFASSPVLGESFLAFDPTTVDRMFAVQESGVAKFWCYVNNQVTVRRPLPYFGTPNTLGF